MKKKFLALPAMALCLVGCTQEEQYTGDLFTAESTHLGSAEQKPEMTDLSNLMDIGETPEVLEEIANQDGWGSSLSMLVTDKISVSGNSAQLVDGDNNSSISAYTTGEKDEIPKETYDALAEYVLGSATSTLGSFEKMEHPENFESTTKVSEDGNTTEVITRNIVEDKVTERKIAYFDGEHVFLIVYVDDVPEEFTATVNEKIHNFG